MGKFLKRSIRADAAVILEGVRSRGRSAGGGGGAGMELKRKPVESGELNERKAVKRWSSGGGGEDEDGEHLNIGGGEEEAVSTDPRMNPSSQEEESQENLMQQQHQESDSNWIEEGEGTQKEEEESSEEDAGGVLPTNSRLLLRASHSDSCLRSRVRDPIRTTAGHSRSNSASFSHEQSLGLALVNSSSGLQDATRDESQHFGNLREAEPCYDDNTLVFYEESQPSTISRTKEDEDVEQREAPTPGSTSRQLNYPTLVRDCGPGWRHRSGAPTGDELEDFFARVESEKDDRERFIEKYNFDILNDVPLPGRFEWESLQKT